MDYVRFGHASVGLPEENIQTIDKIFIMAARLQYHDTGKKNWSNFLNNCIHVNISSLISRSDLSLWAAVGLKKAIHEL